MEMIQSNQTGTAIQLNLFESIKDLLLVKPIFLIGVFLIGFFLFWIFNKDKTLPKLKITVLSLVMYYYLCLMLVNIVGIPTLDEYKRLLQLGETFFNPNVNLIPFSDGFSLSFILNIFLFIPFGFLCPLISKSYERIRNTFLIGMGLSFFIEIVQLFTLYRATDINDLLTNGIGTILGYLCFRLITRFRIVKRSSKGKSIKKDYTVYIPFIIILVTFVLGFFS